MSSLTLSIIAAMDKPSLKMISEEDFQKAVCGFAAASGYLVHYQRRSGFNGKDGTWKGSGLIRSSGWKRWALSIIASGVHGTRGTSSPNWAWSTPRHERSHQ